MKKVKKVSQTTNGLEEKHLNLRVYKLNVIASGEQFFCIKEKDERGNEVFGNLRECALSVKNRTTEFNTKNKRSLVNIDFSPFHDIEIASDLAPRNCFSLSGKERTEFWIYFNN